MYEERELAKNDQTKALPPELQPLARVVAFAEQQEKFDRKGELPDYKEAVAVLLDPSDLELLEVIGRYYPTVAQRMLNVSEQSDGYVRRHRP